MAVNFEKVLAATVLKPNGSDKFMLADKQMSKLLTIITDMTFIGAYGTMLDDKTIDSGSVTYLKNVAGTLEDKPVGQIGAGALKRTDVGDATIKFDQNKMIREGLAAWDTIRGLEGLSAKKLAKFLDQIKKDWERKGYAKIKAATTAQANKVNISKADLNDATKIAGIRTQIITAATKITKVVDTAQGLDQVSRDAVMIDLEPVFFDKLVAAAVIGDLATQAYVEGRFSIGTMGGYTVRSVPFLEDEDTVGNMMGVITTNFSFAAPLKIVAANVEKAPFTNDTGIYAESGYGSGYVYDKVTTLLIAAA